LVTLAVLTTKFPTAKPTFIENAASAAQESKSVYYQHHSLFKTSASSHCNKCLITLNKCSSVAWPSIYLSQSQWPVFKASWHKTNTERTNLMEGPRTHWRGLWDFSRCTDKLGRNFAAS